MSWLIWPLHRKIVLLHIVLRKSGRHQRDPRVPSHRGIAWCKILHLGLHKEMPQWVGLSLGRLSNKEDSDLQCLSNSNSSSNNSNLTRGRMPHSSIVGIVIIDVSTAAVLLILPRIVHNPEGIIQGKTLIRTTTTTTTTTRARARGKWCKSGKGELISLLLQTFQQEHQ